MTTIFITKDCLIQGKIEERRASIRPNGWAYLLSGIAYLPSQYNLTRAEAVVRAKEMQQAEVAKLRIKANRIADFSFQ